MSLSVPTTRDTEAKAAAPHFFSVRDVSQYVGRSAWTVRSWINRGFLPASQVGETGPWMVEERDLFAFMERHRHDPKRRSVLRGRR